MPLSDLFLKNANNKRPAKNKLDIAILLILNILSSIKSLKKKPKVKIFGNDYKTKDGTCERDFIHVVDLAKGHVAAIKKINTLNGYNIFNLGTGNPVSVLEIINHFQNINKINIPYIFTKRRDGDIESSYCDTSHTYKILNWKTTKTIQDICKDAWRFQKLNPNGL